MPVVTATFVISLTFILGVYWLFVVRVERRATRELLRRIAPASPEAVEATSVAKKPQPLSALKFFDAVLARCGHLLDPLDATIRMSGLPLTPGAIVLASTFAAIVVSVGIGLLTSEAWIGLMTGGIAAAAPLMFVRHKANKRTRRIEEQFPQAVDLIAVSLRAGHAFTTGLLIAAEEIEEPLGAEFRIVYDQQNYGKPLPEVLKAFAERVALLDARMFVTAVLTQRETGGNLAEILDRMSSLIRERFRVRRQVRAMSAHGRMTGLVLSMLPVVLAALLIVIAPSHMAPLIEDPLGLRLVAGAVVLQLLGVLTIKRIVNVDY